MKKTIISVLIFVIITSIMAGCNKNITNITDDELFKNYNDNINNSAVQETIYIDSGVVDYEKTDFEFNGIPLEFDYRYRCSADCEMGLQLFVNGVLQEFTVNDTLYSLYKVNCKSNHDMIFHVSFTPNNGVKGETSSLIFANIYNPEVIEFDNSVNSFGNYQKISQPMPWGIKMNTDVDDKILKISNNYKKQTFKQEELKKFIRYNNDGSKKNLLNERMFFDTSKEFERINIKKESTVNFDLYGNFIGKYRISLYADFERIDINGANYIDIDVEKNTKYTIIINTADLKNHENIYAIAVALDNTEGLIKSNSYFIEK